METIYFFCIGPPSYDGGFSWGDSRPHYAGRLRDGVPEDIPDAVFSALLQAWEPHRWGGWEFLLVEADDPKEAIANCELSAGDENAWEGDVYLGIADYLSVRAWFEELGVAAALDYMLPSQDALSDEAVREVLRYVDSRTLSANRWTAQS